MASNTFFCSSADENRWVMYIKDMLKELEDDLNNVPISVFHVPKSLSSAKPEAFVPQLIALGPYHHLRPELYPMERYKLAAAYKALQRYTNYLQFHDLVFHLQKEMPKIRASYHKYLELNNETLAWIMTIDSLFLLEFLHSYNDKVSLMKSSTGFNLVRSGGQKLTKDGIIRDILMLENQIPILALRMILHYCGFKENDDNIDAADLASLFEPFCRDICPIKLETSKSQPSNFTDVEVTSNLIRQTHLLGYMYHLLLLHKDEEDDEVLCSNKSEGKSTKIPFSIIAHNDSNNQTIKNNNILVKTFMGFTRAILGLFHLVKRPLDWILNWFQRLSSLNLAVLRPFKGPMNCITELAAIPFGFSTNASFREEGAPPIIAIPSVEEMVDAGAEFRPAKGGITTITFRKRTATFELPHIKLGVNSEVVLRNLVAHEALTKSNYLIFTRYTELMRAIIDTKEDVKILRKKNIIDSDLRDDDIADLFNGMCKSIGPTDTKDLDEVIEDVNIFYNNTRKIKAYKIMSKYVYSSWKIFTLLATIFFLFLMGLQTFCSVYSCPRIFKTEKSN